MKSAELQKMAAAIAWCQKFPTDMTGLTVKLVDFTGVKSFRALYGESYPTLSVYRAVRDRVARLIRKRGGRVTTARVNVIDYRVWLKRHRMKDTRLVREMWLENFKRWPSAGRRPQTCCDLSHSS